MCELLHINPLDPVYGALGNGVNDDWSPLQSAINVAIRERKALVIPPGNYCVTRSLNITPASGSQQRLHIYADGAKLLWTGAPDSTVVYSKGWKNATIQGLHVDCGNAARITAWDLDTPNDAPSTGGLTFTNCQVSFGNGGGCVGWRGSVNGDKYGDVSALLFLGCMVRGLNSANGDIGWRALRRNNLAWTWHAGGALRIKSIFSNRNPIPGPQHGGGSMSFYGLCATENALDFDFYSGGVYLISGGRYETGQRFAHIGPGPASFGSHLRVSGVNIASYAPNDGILFYLGTAATLTLEDCSINRFGGADYDSRLITTNAGANGHGAIRLFGGAIQADTVITLGAGNWKKAIDGVSRIAAHSGSIGWLNA